MQGALFQSFESFLKKVHHSDLFFKYETHVLKKEILESTRRYQLDA